MEARVVRKAVRAAAAGETLPLDGLADLVSLELWLRRLLARRGTCWTGTPARQRAVPAGIAPQRGALGGAGGGCAAGLTRARVAGACAPVRGRAVRLPQRGPGPALLAGEPRPRPVRERHRVEGAVRLDHQPYGLAPRDVDMHGHRRVPRPSTGPELHSRTPSACTEKWTSPSLIVRSSTPTSAS